MVHNRSWSDSRLPMGGTLKPFLSGHSKNEKTKVLMTNGSSMKSKVLQNALLDLHLAIIGLENQCLVFFEWLLNLTGLLCIDLIHHLQNFVVPVS